MRVQNKQEVGRRIVERALTAVPVVFLDPGRHPAEDLGLVDGNSRWTSCTAHVPAPTGLIGPAKDKERPSLLPSYLMSLPLTDRRSLVREVIKKAYCDIKAASDRSKAARAKRDQAAALLNAMTVPVEVVIGYTDDDPNMGMQRFPAAVRSLLMRMNIGVKESEDASKNGITTEETVTALFDAGELGDNAQAVKDVLLGRVDITGPMKSLGLSTLRDLRFALIAQQLTRKEPRLNAITAAKRNKHSLQLGGRSGLVTELGLRSYSAFPGDGIKPVRTALESGYLREELIGHEWTIENIDNDQAVDDLLQRADNGDISAKLLLGVLAMVTLVTSGNLLAPGGSAEQIVNHTVMRANIGTVVKAVLEREEGPQALDDLIKLHKKNDTTDQLSWESVEASVKQIRLMDRGLLRMSEEEPLVWLTPSEPVNCPESRRSYQRERAEGKSHTGRPRAGQTSPQCALGPHTRPPRLRGIHAQRRWHFGMTPSRGVTRRA